MKRLRWLLLLLGATPLGALADDYSGMLAYLDVARIDGNALASASGAIAASPQGAAQGLLGHALYRCAARRRDHGRVACTHPGIVVVAELVHARRGATAAERCGNLALRLRVGNQRHPRWRHAIGRTCRYVAQQDDFARLRLHPLAGARCCRNSRQQQQQDGH